MPHFTQSWVRGKKRAGGLAGRGRCCPGAEGAQSPELRQPGAAAGSSGCPAAGRGRQTPRRRRGMLRTALPDRPQRPEGQSAGTQPAESGWHSVLHGPGLLQVHTAELQAVLSGCGPKIVSDPPTSLTWQCPQG